MARPPLRRPCLACGLAPGNSRGITVLRFRLQRFERQRHMVSVAVGLCAECLADALPDAVRLQLGISLTRDHREARARVAG